jgi:uncharacterized protein YecE (DUF72 family)
VIRIGTAGWAIPRAVADRFPADGSALERYAARFAAAEINSTFHRSHRPATYERWEAAVPPDFRFAVKLPKAITHRRKLVDAAEPLATFLDEIAPLGPKLGPLLVQLPPKLAFDSGIAGAFFAALRARVSGAIACEPRHPSWFAAEPDRLLASFVVARVAADPARVPEAAVPGGASTLAYWRLHGSPRMYFSPYGRDFTAALAARLAASRAAETWCVFDNTASGAAAADALDLADCLGAQ